MPGGVTNSPQHFSLAGLVLFCHWAGSEGFWLGVAFGHLICDAGGSQELSSRGRTGGCSRAQKGEKTLLGKNPQYT